MPNTPLGAPATDTFTELAIAQLHRSISGRVITADDPMYDSARTVFYGGTDSRPLLIVQVANATDVSHVVAFARETGLELAVRSGGHSIAGHSTTDGGIVIDLSGMKGLEIDVERRTAWAETGLTAGEYTNVAASYGLATGFGDTGSVGIGGITLGGGIGYLVRKYGLTIDDLLAAEMVTADGQTLHVDHTKHPDLFWAIRGGGGNFGVVTRFQYRLHEISTVVGGMLVLPATPDVIARFVAAAEAAPDELSTIANVMTAPPMPFLPAASHGQRIVMATLVYTGSGVAGERAIAPFRAIATPIVDMVKPICYPELYPTEESPIHPVATGHTMFVNTIDHGIAATILDHLQASTALIAVTQIRVLGGAVARVPSDATAFAHRTSRIMLNVAALSKHPAEAAEHAPWVNALAGALRQSDEGVYINFLSNEGVARVRAAYPAATWGRLVAIKDRYDPTNLFRRNHNIPPTMQGRSSAQKEASAT